MGAAPTAPSLPVREVALSIGGMTCGACAARIERRLNGLQGVEARVNFASHRAAVTLPARGSLAPVLEAVSDVGFTAEEVVDPRRSAETEERLADERARSLGRRLIVSGLLFMPLCDASIAFSVVPWMRFPGWQWLLIALAAPVVVWAAWPFHAAALRNARHGTTSMDTLVSLGIVVATGWSLYAIFFVPASAAQHSIGAVLTHHQGSAIYLDVAAGVTTFMLAGRYYEARSRRRAGAALRRLADLSVREVTVLADGGGEELRPIADLAVGQEFVARPGERVATDGVVVSGRSGLDRSLITGESLPVDVGPGDRVLGGTISTSGRLVVRATEVGSHTQLAEMTRLVEHAQNEKASVQRLADRVAGVFVPSVLAVAVVTLAGWLLSGSSVEQSLNAAISVLIIACPCALGLATPAALFVASGRGARLGVFFKGYPVLESSRGLDTVVWDKTGTVTWGRMTVTGVETAEGLAPEAVLRWAGALERGSEHSLARAIVSAARSVGGDLPEVGGFENLPGRGVRGEVEGRRVFVGRPGEGAADGAVAPPLLDRRRADWEGEGRTTVELHLDGRVVGLLALGDTVRPTARAAVEQLRRMGLHSILLSGDGEAATRAVAASVGITEVVARALPAEKVAVVERLRAEGRSVAVVGDGVNDAPALARADLGLAVGSGTDVAIEAADLIVVRDDLQVVPTAIDLARRTLRTIHGNLVWAFFYNVVAIPLAALGFLDPIISAAAMALSSGFVIWNSSRLSGVGRTGDGGRRPAVDRRPPVRSPDPAEAPTVAAATLARSGHPTD